jgi:hypothetical protein
MKKDYKNFNYLKEKLGILMSKYCIYSFRVKNQQLVNNNKTIWNNTDYIWIM